jgi:DNA-binding SARP family transcriptional activator/TolB-like protein
VRESPREASRHPSPTDQNRIISASFGEKSPLRLKTFGGLWVENVDGHAVDAAPRPRPLALLAVLAAAGDKGATRDQVLGILWPDTDQERARHALSQTLYNLRRDFDGDVVLTTPALRLDPNRMTSDVADFRAAVAEKRWIDAAALCGAPFLDGFYLADAPEFERWVESERGALATQGVRALEIAAKACADAGRLEEAAEFWRRLTRHDPTDSRIAAAYMEALAALGDRAAAVAHGRAHGDVLRRELEVGPDAAVQRLMTRLRETTVVQGSVAATSAIASTSAVKPVSPTTQDAPTVMSAIPVLPASPVATPRRSRWRTALVASAVAVLAVATSFAWRAAQARRDTALPVLAVGRIRNLTAPDSAALGAVLSEMLATSLGRLDELQVIANSRMLELTPRDADTSRQAFTVVARRAGASEVVEGELIPSGGGQLRLEVRRVDVQRGLVRGGYRVSGTDPFALFDSVTAMIAADLRLGAPAGSFAAVSSRSPVAYRFYEEGLRALYQYDAYAANRLFKSAVREDSTFPMATYYAWRSALAIGDPDVGELARRAVALALRASARDRLLILTHVGAARNDVRALAAAETLATRYPRDPEALVRAAEVAPQLSRAIELLDRSITIDSAAGPGSVALCRLCDALNLLALRYRWADSASAVERTLSRWIALRPNDATPWGLRADWFIAFGRRAQSDAALRRYEALGGLVGNTHLAQLINHLRLDDFEAADRECGDGLAVRDTTEFLRYRWFCVIALRMEGRYRDALALARYSRVTRSGTVNTVRHGIGPEPYQVAILDMMLGRAPAAADAFLALANAIPDTAAETEGLRTRNRAWLLTLSATAAVAGGDTLRARRMVDSIDIIGHRSLFGRDPLLHHFVRGLLHARAHDDEAAVREFRAAISSPTYGYTRINYELGTTLLALGQPAEGITLVQGALHGGIEGSGLYVTRTELHELLAKLFDANHQVDSAAAHYTVVARAWAGADGMLEPRRAAARQWLAVKR